jgi:hypothetical protein
MNQDTASVVFLSHNSADKPAVEELARRLLDCTPPIRCWLDKDDLSAQGTWMRQVEDVIASCEAAAIFYGPSGLGRVHEVERQLLIDRATQQPDTFRLTPVLLPGAKPVDIKGFAKLHNWVDFTAGLDSPAAFERLVAFLRGEAPRSTTADDELAPGLEPYRGLERFDVEHAGVFFGRDREIRELCGRMRSWPFVAVIGGSGSGKSSLVRAGLKTALAFGEFPRLKEAIRITVLPGANPLRALADQVAAAIPKPDGQAPEALADAFEARFRERPDGLLTLLTSRFSDDSTAVLIVVDQFEELFTHCRDTPGAPGRCRSQTEQFVRLLDAVARSGVGRLGVVVTVRADFLGRCLQVAPLVALVQDRQFLLGELSAEPLREVIVRPAQQAGAYFEKGLVARILRDVEGEHGSLPLLQQALKELWALRRGRWLTNEDYDKTGGVAGALRKRAEETISSLDPVQREIARNIFLRLTTPGEGVGDTRRRARLEELYRDRDDRAAVDTVIDRLRAKESRLIVTNDDGTAEVTHEALIRSWGQLKTWLDADRTGLRTHRRLTEAAQDWAAAPPRLRRVCSTPAPGWPWPPSGPPPIARN